MKKTICVCDKCGKTISDVVYTLTCYAEDLDPGLFGGVAPEVVQQNFRQNLASTASSVERHLCRECKDSITDGLFIV